MSEKITANDLHAARAVRIIDIRKAPGDRQIPGSERRNGEQLATSDTLPFEPNESVVLYCGSGNSCSRIAAQLRERGYDVSALEGGYAAWAAAGLPTEPRSEAGVDRERESPG